MDATSFELNVWLPSDPRYAKTMGELAVHAARYAGCRGADADRFGAAVESVAGACLAEGAAAPVAVVMRRGVGPLEFLIGCDGTVETTTGDAHITIGWTEEGGRRMCRVARAMPVDV